MTGFLIKLKDIKDNDCLSCFSLEEKNEDNEEFNKIERSYSELYHLNPIVVPKLNPIACGSDPSLLHLDDDNSNLNMSCPNNVNDSDDDSYTADDSPKENLSIKGIRKMMNKLIPKKLNRSFSIEGIKKQITLEDEEICIEMDNNPDEYDYYDDDSELSIKDDDDKWNMNSCKQSDEKFEECLLSIYQIMHKKQLKV